MHTEEQTLKFCVNCKHRVVHPVRSVLFCDLNYKTGIDLVTGKPTVLQINRSCYKERHTTGLCKPEGLFYEEDTAKAESELHDEPKPLTFWGRYIKMFKRN